MNGPRNTGLVVSVSARDKETGQKQSITVTASGGLTEAELQKILEEQGDYMLEARVSDELKNRRTELESVMKEVSEMLPRVQKLTEGSEFGVDAVAKAIKGLESAKRARDQGNLAFEVIDRIHLNVLFMLRHLRRLLASSLSGKVSFDAFNADGGRTGPIKNRNVTGHSAD